MLRIGDVLICGAFCTYIGFFDLFMRQRVIQLWREKLDEAEIKQRRIFPSSPLSCSRFAHRLSHLCAATLKEYLSKPSERLQWKQNVAWHNWQKRVLLLYSYM